MSGRDGLATTVTSIVDGDTLYVAALETRVRLIGIDTPETRGGPVECFGPEATAHITKLVPVGTEVVITRDVEQVDRYDRPLVYLYRADDDLFVNEAMVADGYASAYSVPPNVAHQDLFVAAQREARDNDRGLWGAACDDDAEPDEPVEPDEPDDGDGEDAPLPAVGGGGASIVIAHIEYDAPGDDVQFDQSEYVVLENTSDDTVDVGGWTLTDLKDHRITIPSGYAIQSGGRLQVHTGPGTNSSTAFHHGAGQAIWNNSGGDTATLRDAGGNVIDEYSYSS